MADVVVDLVAISSLTIDFNAKLADDVELEIDADFWCPLVGDTEDGFFGDEVFDALSGKSTGLGELEVDMEGDAYRRLILVDEYDLEWSDAGWGLALCGCKCDICWWWYIEGPINEDELVGVLIIENLLLYTGVCCSAKAAAATLADVAACFSR